MRRQRSAASTAGHSEDDDDDDVAVLELELRLSMEPAAEAGRRSSSAGVSEAAGTAAAGIGGGRNESCVTGVMASSSLLDVDQVVDRLVYDVADSARDRIKDGISLKKRR